jgi:uncharacterized protein
MKIEYDENKSQRNIELRRLSFELVKQFDFENMLDAIDPRHESEVRTIATSRIRFHVYTLVYTLRGETIRVISLRKASRKERKAWRIYLTLIS